MTQSNLISIVTMWSKINELSRQSLSQMQIALKLGISRDTVRRYQRMNEKEFEELVSSEILRRKRKLEAFEGFIQQLLQDSPFLSAAQIYDRLKEHFPDLPEVSERTVYNTVRLVREREDLPKVQECGRQMSKVPDCEYGEKAQVDFGEKVLRTSKGSQVKVYFMVMVLQRSRYKFVYLQNTPFTAKTTVYAHHLAFNYFGGMPRKVIYDQDRKMLVSENFGDYVMTEEFARYVNAAGFEPVFCMPYDPASKGQSEAVVKYVKNNFLAGRTYVNIESLNDEAIGWLSRTANAKVNSSTRLIPAEEFKKEQPMLALYVEEIEEPEMEAREYSVRKDNTLLYHSNFYSLPLGTYAGQGTKVLVIKNVDSNELEIYDPKDFCLIARHKISPFRGKYINKDEHASSRSRDILESEQVLHTFFNEWADDSLLSRFLKELHDNRPRYYRKSVTSMASLLTDYDKTTAHTLLEMFAESKVYNANVMREMALQLADRMENQPKSKPVAADAASHSADLTPEKRSIDTYGAIIDGKEDK